MASSLASHAGLSFFVVRCLDSAQRHVMRWLSDLLANCLLAASFRLTACAERRDIGIENLGSSL